MHVLILSGLITLAFPPIPAALDFEEEILAAHNEERIAAGTPPLRWDRRLARDAQNWAQHISLKGELVHARYTGQGENLSMGTAGGYSLRDFIGAWIEEKAMYHNGRFPNIVTQAARADGVDWHKVGHYSQLVWRETTHVGCAVVTENKWDYLVCRYSPPGNRKGQKAY